MLTDAALTSLAETLRQSRGIVAKADIAAVAAALDLSGGDVIPVGDDCAAIPDGDGYTLFAIEGFMNEFVAADPWFAGWCGAMVNISDVVAMGGRPTAIVNAIWSNGADKAAPILEGLKAAAKTFGVPVIGGHTNLRSNQSQFAVAILGRAKRLLTSFDARPGDKLIAATDLRGRYRDPFANWEAATDAPAERLRGDLEILPSIAEAGLALAAKDISQGGIVGTAAMLAECSQVAITLDVEAVPIPAGAPLERWLLTFPSFGYLLSAKPEDVDEILSRFQRRGIAAAAIGDVSVGARVDIRAESACATVWDFAEQALIGCAPGESHQQRSVA
ncbi:sll0787 family AIR synthase-like protein [Bradyrhizobium sp. CCBAU 53338]|uniref:sll0787 family AIR synthase-like protein n=1 Tax=Bradyrhizobium sp. CCBAU 53338 TaxID=1325111 RepID=UPI00188A0EC5|nr:sll0787 family AIR synthase-like protein [Bradyrhizobium sp. CCBAU 53338]QOZ51435.1 sll0787 family AIR synthase-like protein [Bradyrhizobium sp. CCBAU 53338]